MREQLLYLRDVLGVQGLIRPEGQVAPTVEKSRPLVVLLKDSWNVEAKVLVEKILTATGLGQVSTSFEIVRAQHVIIFDSEEMVGKSANGETTFWNMGPLAKLLSGSAVEIQNAKREVWTLLKQLKEEAGV